MNSRELIELGRDHLEEYEVEEAYRCFLEAALMDDPEAIIELGIAYLYGRGVNEDFKKAFHYFKTAYTLKRDLSMMWDISEVRDDLILTEEGRNAYMDFIEFLLENEEWEMYIYMADEYSDGGIFPENTEKKIEYLNKAIEHGIDMGFDCLGEMYFLGEKVEQDYKRAYEYFMSYEGNASFAKPYYLGEMYRRGLYPKKDADKAKQLYLSITESDNPAKYYDKYYEPAAEHLKLIRRHANAKMIN